MVLGESLHATQPEAPTAMGHTYSMWGSGERSLHLYGRRGRDVHTCGSPPVQDRYNCASAGKCDSNRKKALDRSVCGDTSTAPKIRTRSGGPCLPQKTLADLKPLTELMHAHRSGLCSVMEEFCHLYVDPIQPCVLPKSLLRLRDPQMDGCDLSVLLQHCEGLTHLVAVTATEAAALEKTTRQQHKSDIWHSTRAGRITASIIHAVVSTSITRPAKSTVQKVCYPQKPSLRQTDSGPQAIKWGREKEATARVSYITQTELRHRDMKVEHCGFIINPSFPEIGATPDALVHCACCGKGCVELNALLSI